MSMGFSPSSFPEPNFGGARFGQRQRIEERFKSSDLEIRGFILEALYPGDPSHPEGKCPECGHEMTIEEILKGFLDSETDTTTKCPVCDYRFQPALIIKSLGRTRSVAFYCEKQTAAYLRDISRWTFEAIQEQAPQVLASARWYWGSLTAGFASIGVAFTGEPKMTWQDKVVPFLGLCPDEVIAELCNVTPSVVRRLRVSRGVDTFTRSN